ncbi:transcriptional regulator NrdR [Candidatus Falkowbacteria bacterium CG10_big_fil_rev_8_21_14_0_10_39_11]|uniref:Transcriptional repressor NrdR n=1 Tax=Candidatus Falkowbacteria bacterium CG10_big_fil_rev_8_21_14_0_10_39_11 TaxID=1974565 RepID=A0A2H0V5B0_9BACT|nr:MAG: transcriptional regulator NrdR [Candidatus Falkowbacteria bacterium CG10_big_fil_rev_8_21_14_0_10_39_11]
MKCPVCYNEDTKVLDSRVAADGLAIRRRRECSKCNFRFSTYEEVELLDVSVLKRDGNRESYSREKMEKGLRRALEKREFDVEKFKKLVNNIERDIQVFIKNKKEGSVISSEDVGAIVMKNLKKVDKVAYIRFASVYKLFTDAEEFEEEVKKLIRKK